MAFGLLYYRSVLLQPVGDDWMLLGPVKSLQELHGFWDGLLRLFQYRLYDFYRPLAMLPLYVGYDHLPVIQVCRLCLVLLQGYFVFRLSSHLGISAVASVIAGAVVLLHQLGVAVYLQHDLWGDILGGAGLLIILVDSIRLIERRLSLGAYLWHSGLITAATLLSKESGLAAAIIPIAVGWAWSADRRTWRSLLLGELVIVLVCGAYIAYRMWLGFAIDSDPSGYYALHFGLNIPKNIALVAAGTLNPMNTVDVYLSGLGWRTAAALWITVLAAAVIWAVFKQMDIKRRRIMAVLSLLAVASLGPALLMPHVHEANVLRCLLFSVPAVTLGILSIWTRLGRKLQIGMVILLTLWLVFDLSAVYGKVQDLLAASKTAASFRRDMIALLPQPDSDYLGFIVEWPEKRGYNLYRRPLYAELRYGELEWGLPFIYSRPHLRVKVDLVGSLDSAANASMEADYAVGVDGKPIRWRTKAVRAETN